MSLRKSRVVRIILVLSSIYILGGCLSFSKDITPPPEESRSLEIDTTDPTPTSQNGSDITPSPDPASERNPTPEATLDVVPGEVTVEVVNQGEGGDLPSGLQVTLEGFDHMNRVYRQALPVNKGDRITFKSVPFKPGRMYVATMIYQGAVYRSDIVEVKPDSPSLDLVVEVYDTTTDQAALSIERLHVFVNFSQKDVVQFGEMFTISNFGEKTVIAKEKGGPVLDFFLPEGAENLRFESGSLGERYLLTEEGFGDTLSIPPGSGVYQMLVFFDMPYENQRLEFEQKMTLPVGAVVVIIPAEGVQLKNSSLKDLGVREVQDGSIHVYSGEQLHEGEDISFSLSGLPGQPGLGNEAVSGENRRNVIIGLSVFGGVLFFVGRSIYLQSQKDGDWDSPLLSGEVEKEEIMDAIIALDDSYANGEIKEDAYRARRSDLKSRLAALIEEEE